MAHWSPETAKRFKAGRKIRSGLGSDADAVLERSAATKTIQTKAAIPPSGEAIMGERNLNSRVAERPPLGAIQFWTSGPRAVSLHQKGQ